MITTIEGGITAPAGFRAAGVHCGIKANPEKLDLALVVSDQLASAAAVFTTNLAVAPPIVVSREHLQASGGRARAVVVNSGCANACTGDQGRQVAHLMAAETARAVDCELEEVLVMSTGVIGVRLDPHTVTQGIIDAADVLAAEAHAAAARAIMTTDPFPKERAVEVTTPRGTFRIGGICKGSGMIEPRMATMLGVLTCDAAVPPALLQRVLSEVTEHTFNAITVDGECSTNDCVALLANGASGVTVGEADLPLLSDALYEVCRFLATEIVRGGEGATKVVTVHVTGGRSYDEAKQAARAIANSLLVKTAIHGGDPNWGRLVAVAGRAGVAFRLEHAAVRIGDIVLFEHGRPFDERAPQAAEYLQGHAIDVTVDLGSGGRDEATMWTCDLSKEYVQINAEYRT
ncbi:MAG TPA: bifunctional glutamate N-acetyltransferase/amino-acid acetyltransferase ArgJ [Luteitalea sp.]|nr:bifunctional glutamate N-acetyltransferase/amino-acid acetyltransferase ArgJ [Luteitalea sp.]